MDAIRKQLDVLMGANRNGDVTEVNRKYYDRDVCRLFLVGLCPHELFQLTKMDMGPCPKLHSLQLRRELLEPQPMKATELTLSQTCNDISSHQFGLHYNPGIISHQIVHTANYFRSAPFGFPLRKALRKAIHDEGVQGRIRYKEARAKGLDNYDRELEDVIDRLIVECDRKITRALKRLEDEDAKAAIAISVSEVTQTPEALELSKQIKEKLKEVDQYDLEGNTDLKIRALEIVEELRSQRADKQSMLLLDAFNKDRASLPQPVTNPPPLAPLPVVAPDARTQELINEKLKKAEDLGEQGMVDEAQKALEEAEALRKLVPRAEPVTDPSKYTAADVRITDQKLRVCDICGAFLSVYDSDRRLADHFGGKLHLGYMQIREKLAELLEERGKKEAYEDERRSKEQSREQDRGASKDRDHRDSRERGRDYDRRSRDRDRHYDRDHGYDREHERGRDRLHTHDSRSRRRSRSRSRERSRDYDRHRRYDRY